MINPRNYPSKRFSEAWKLIHLYSEHTCGANTSVTEPESQKSTAQWEFKKSIAEKSDSLSRQLINDLFRKHKQEQDITAIDVYNTNSRIRSDLVTLPVALDTKGNRVLDSNGKPVPSQRLSSGELIFIANEVLPFSSKRYQITHGTPPAMNPELKIDKTSISNDLISIKLDEDTGNIIDIRAQGIDENLVDSKSVDKRFK